MDVYDDLMFTAHNMNTHVNAHEKDTQIVTSRCNQEEDDNN